MVSRQDLRNLIGLITTDDLDLILEHGRMADVIGCLCCICLTRRGVHAHQVQANIGNRIVFEGNKKTPLIYIDEMRLELTYAKLENTEMILLHGVGMRNKYNSLRKWFLS